MELPVDRRSDLQLASVHELALESRRELPPAIDEIASNRVADEGQMHPKLVCAAGQQVSLDQSEIAQPLEHAEGGLGRSSISPYPHLLAVVQIAPDRHVDQAFVFGDLAMHKQRVAFPDR